jgi:hypothetical protein
MTQRGYIPERLPKIHFYKRQFRELTEQEVQQVWDMSVIHCRDWEIAHALDFNTKNWAEYREAHPEIQEFIDKARSQGATQLRRAQMVAALNGNTQMQIWLGRHILGQNWENRDTMQSGPIQLSDVSPESKQRLLELRNAIYKQPTEIEVEELTDVNSSDVSHPGTVGSASDDDHKTTD